MASENTIYFYPGQGGHSHDGENSSFIDTSKYSLFDFSWGFLGDPYRVSSQTMNYNSFQNFIVETINNAVLKPAGLILQPGTVNGDSDIISNSISTKLIAADAITANEIAANTITANEIAANTITANQIAANTITAGQIAANTITAAQIAAGAITADELSANIVLVNNVIASSNYSPGVSGWAINGNGNAEFANTSIRGTIAANSVTTPGIDIDSSGNLTSNASTFGIYANGAIFTSSGNFSVNTSGVLSATGATVRGEISSGTFVTHNRFGVDINYTRPTVLIDNTNNEFALNTTGGGIRLNGNQWLAYRSGDSFYRMNLDFGAASYSFLGSFYIDGALQSSSHSTGGITASGVTYNPSNLVGGFPIAFGYDIGSGQLRAIVNNDTNVYFSLTKTFISDRRLKNNIEPISSTALDRFYSIKTYEFDWNDKTPEHVRKWGRTVGVIADELKELYPIAVDGSDAYEGWVHRYDEHPEGFSIEEMEKFGSDFYEFVPGEGVWQKPRYASVDYTVLIPHLISAVHDLNNRVKELESKV